METDPPDLRDRLLEEALGLEGAARDEFLATACSGRDALRREIEQLVALDANSDGAESAGEALHQEIERLLGGDAGRHHPPPDYVATPAPPQVVAGQTVGRFVIRREIGRGGMSCVYEAKDPAIGRPVALKILSARGTDQAGRARFFQELQLLGPLEHDHIVRLYEFGEHDDALYLVMELLDGEDLGASIAAQRTGPFERKVDIALQIADAVREIHRAGIVHRDIKPGNVFLESTGRAKLLDFGIAHHGSADSGSPVVGTLEHMAPEQLRGRATPASDVYAYGVLLFQLFTGHKPFTGEHVLEVLSNVAFERLPSEPMRAAQLPDSLSRLIVSLTAKDQAARPTLDAATACLQAALAEDGEGAEPGRPSSRMMFAAVVAAAMAGSAAYGWYSGYFETDSSRAPLLDSVSPADAAPPTGVRNADPSVRLDSSPGGSASKGGPLHLSMAMPKELTFRLIEGTELAVSPDGERIVFRAALANGTRRLYLRNLDSLQPPTMLPATDYGRLPFWSPDGNAIAFFADHKLKRVNIVEGTVQVVCEARSARGGSWNSDGMIIFAPHGGADGLYVVSAEGGTPRQVTTLNRSRGETAHTWPSFLSDGHRFLYSIDGNDASRAGTYVQVLGSERHTRVLGVTSNVSYAAGHLLFANAESLMAVPFSVEEVRVVGEPYQVGTGVATFPRRADFSAGGGVLGYWRGSEQVDNITWLGRDGRLLHTFPAPDLLVHPDLSADGRFLAFSKGKDIWVLDSTSGVHSRLTMTASADYYPIWAPDGKQLVFASDQPRHGMYLVDMSNGQQTRLLAEGDELYPTDWSRDGNYLVYEKKDGATGTRDVWVLPLIGDRKPIPVAATRADERNGQISPDNHWVSYTARDSGYWQVYLTALQGAGRVRQISSGQGVQPKWAADSNELFYLRPDRQLMATTISGTSELQFSLPRPLFHVDAADVHPRGLYSVTADVRRFMFITSPPPDQELITIVTNWSRPRRARY